MSRLPSFIWKATKRLLLVSLTIILLAVLFAVGVTFREQRIPVEVFRYLLADRMPSNIVVRVGSASFSVLSGLHVSDISVIDTDKPATNAPIAAAESLEINPLGHVVKITGAKYPRLPDSYYAPVNNERNSRVDFTLPDLPKFQLVLIRPDILSVAPERVIADVRISSGRVSIERVRLNWPDEDEKMFLDGACTIDFEEQKIFGNVYGSAKQSHIRPLLVTLDVPSAMPYFDAFTEVPGKIPSSCDWSVNLVNNDLDLHLGLHPEMGRYNDVPMSRADGDLYLHVYTRDGWLNYRHVFGPITGIGPSGEPLKGTVRVSGTNGYNRVEVEAESSLHVADLLRIGGFTGDYIEENVFGDCSCNLVFEFPRSMTNNYEALNGSGRMKIVNGQIMRMKGFKGLLALLADKVPGVSWFTDSTQASCDYVIENGILKTDNIYIEGSVFSIKMYGLFDAPANKLDFTVRVQFTKRNSFMGKLLHPLAWPFTKLLLEFRLTGTPQDPKWHYISVIDRVVEAAK